MERHRGLHPDLDNLVNEQDGNDDQYCQPAPCENVFHAFTLHTLLLLVHL